MPRTAAVEWPPPYRAKQKFCWQRSDAVAASRPRRGYGKHFRAAPTLLRRVGIHLEPAGGRLSLLKARSFWRVLTDGLESRTLLAPKRQKEGLTNIVCSVVIPRRVWKACMLEGTSVIFSEAFAQVSLVSLQHNRCPRSVFPCPPWPSSLGFLARTFGLVCVASLLVCMLSRRPVAAACVFAAVFIMNGEQGSERMALPSEAVRLPAKTFFWTGHPCLCCWSWTSTVPRKCPCLRLWQSRRQRKPDRRRSPNAAWPN